jgi:hypothetical protein
LARKVGFLRCKYYLETWLAKNFANLLVGTWIGASSASNSANLARVEAGATRTIASHLRQVRGQPALHFSSFENLNCNEQE